MSQPNDTTYFVYVGDPMCSWCYGFSGELQTLVNHYQGKIGLNIIVGGLKPYEKEPWDENLREFLREHWVEIEKRTGETFSYEVLNDHNRILDTEPSCRAYKVFESMGVDKLKAFHEVQKVFYVDNLDPLKTESFTKCCATLEVSFEEFKKAFESEKFKAITNQDFKLAQKMGVTGFPALLLVQDDKAYVLSRGYQKAEQLITQINQVVD